MNDNEKRAHDIAVASLQISYDLAKENAFSKSANSNVDFDSYSEYKKLYETYLKLINRDFC